MSSIKALIERHSVPIYFVLTFAISWGGVLLVAGPGGIPDTKEQLAKLLPFAIAVMLAGPSVAGLLLTGLLDGGAGLRELLSRLLRWRARARWYAAALLTAPLLLMAALFALSLASPVFLPGLFTSERKASLLLFGVTAGLGTGFLEELGWTGFAVPRLRARYGILTTGLIVGVGWGAWHIIGPVVLASGGYSGTLSAPLFMTARVVGLLVGGLPAYRVLTVWVYDRTGSLLVAMLMHVSLTASTLIFEPLAISGMSLLILDAVLAIAWWTVVAVVGVAGGGQLSRQPIQRQAA